MEDYRFECWNYKYNRFLPCEILSKIDDKFVRVVMHHEKDGDIYTTTYWSSVRNHETV